MIDPESAIAKKEASIETLKESEETVLTESPLSLSLETIESTSLEALEAQNLELIKNSREASDAETLKVPYRSHTFIKDGESGSIEVPIFDKHTVLESTLPEDLYLKSDIIHFTNATKSAKELYNQNPEKLVKSFKEQNKKILENDKKILESNWDEIKNAEAKMLEATKAKDFPAQEKWLSELRSLTRNVVNIETPKGKPFEILTESEMLQRQIKDITNPSSSTQGRVYGFQWHHHEKPGVLQLVAKNIHEANPHVGGNVLWGGGVR